MSKPDTMYIAFPFGGILPAEVTGAQERKVTPHEPVKVPRTYGRQIVDDRFAYETDPPAPAKKKDAGGKEPAAAPEARLAELRRAAEAATDQAEKDRLAGEIAALEGELAGAA